MPDGTLCGRATPAHPGTWRGAAGNFRGSIRGRPAPERTRGSTIPLPVPDADLLARLRAGDHDAFDACFREWYPAAVRAGARLLRDEEVAEELAQEVFLELWRRRDGLPDGLSVGGYVLQAVRNRALNHLRHLRVRQRSEGTVEHLMEPVPQADAGADARELQRAITEAVAALPPRTREMFLLSRERHLKYAEIAELLGVSVKAVEANVSRALRQLREQLAPFLPSG